MVNTPIPHSLKSEAKKAAKILRDFTMPNAKTGIDKTIPAGLIVEAAGLAILSVVKIGFLVTARGGSGIVIAKDEDGEWTAPSAMGIAGLGGGFEIGAEVTDFVIILNKKAAVEAFSKGGNLTLGGNFTVAAGPMGRNMEGDVAMRSPAAIYTYSKTKGLFAGISIEGSYLVERKDCNKKFYGEEVRAFNILGGEIPRPEACAELYDVLDKHMLMFDRYQDAEAKRDARKAAENPEFTEFQPSSGGGSSKPEKKSRFHRKKNKKPKAKSTAGGASLSVPQSSLYRSASSRTRAASHVSSSDDDAGSQRKSLKQGRDRSNSYTEGLAAAGSDWDMTVKAKAMWDFQGEMRCDLAFRAGDDITIMTRTDTQQDWWEGHLKGRTGIFPANYVEVM